MTTITREDVEAISRALSSLHSSLTDIKSATLDNRAGIDANAAAMEKLADAIERLTRLEEKHSAQSSALERNFKALDKLGERVTVLEMEQPKQKQTNEWVNRAVVAVVGLAAGLTLKKLGML